jgi:hypothetical protein
VKNYLPHGEFRDTNTSAVYAIYRVLRRQPWKSMAIRTWDTMRRFLLSTLVAGALATSFAIFLPTVAQAKTYPVLSSDVRFKFQIGDRTFKPGRYDFIVAGPGIVAMRDSHQHFVASITTRDRDTGGPVSETKLVFNTHNKTPQLIQIWAAKGGPIMDVVGEEMAARPAQPTIPVNSFQPGFGFLFERPVAPGFKH